MSSQIWECDNFQVDKLKLANPVARSGGSYFIRFSINNEPVYIQPPKCFSRQGIIQSNRKYYIDLRFSSNNVDFMEFLEKIESYCQKYIYDNRNEWFEGDLELGDIENYFTPPTKLFKSGKYYLVRSSIPTVLGKPQINIYDEQENEVSIESINEDTQLGTILEVQGIKCSARSFQIAIEVKQMLKMEVTNMFSKCLLTKSKRNEIPDPVDKVLDDLEVNPVPEMIIDSEENIVVSENTPNTIDESNIVDKIENTDVSENTIITMPVEIDNDILANSLENHENNTEVNTDDTEINNDDTLMFDEEKESETENREPEPQSSELFAENTDTQLFSENLKELELNFDDLESQEEVQINERKDVYYKMYKDARKKAKIAKDLALASYLEARNIKNTYMLESIDDSDSDEEIASLEQ
jgi:hypothetical protein